MQAPDYQNQYVQNQEPGSAFFSLASRPDLIEPAVHGLIKTFPNRELQKGEIIKALRSIIELLPDGAKEAFLADTLPCLRQRSAPGPVFQLKQILELLKECAENGSLAVALPLLLKKLPEEPLYKLTSILSVIAEYVEEAAPQVFNVTMPALFEKGSPIFSDLYVFSRLCEGAKQETPGICQVLLSRFEASQSNITFAYVAGEHVNRRELADFINFCCDLADAARSRSFSVPPTALWNAALVAWESWGRKDRKRVSEIFTSRINKLSRPVAPEMIVEALTTLRMDGERTLAILSELEPVAETKSSERFISVLRNVSKIEPLVAGPYLSAFTSLYVTGELLEKPGVVEKMLGNFYNLFGVDRIQKHAKFLSEALKRFTYYDLSELEENLPKLREASEEILTTDYSVGPTSLNYLLVGMHKGTEDSFNQWSISEAEVYRRWNKGLEFNRKPVISTDFSDRFEVSVRQPAFAFRLREGAALDLAFINGRKKLFSPPYPEIQREIISIAARSIRLKERVSSFTHADEIIPVLVEAAKTGPKEFDRVARMSFQLLTTATSIRLADYDPHIFDSGQLTERAEAELGNLYDFLESLRIFIDDRLTITFESAGMPRPFIDRFKQLACLSQINAELRKFEKAGPGEPVDVLFVAAKTVLDMFYDQLAESCILEKAENDIENPIFQPVRMITPANHELIGCWYTLKARVFGEPSLVLAGGGPRGDFARRVDAEEFTAECVRLFKQIAIKNRCMGGVFQAVGPASAKLPWSDDGRIAQRPEIRKALIKSNAPILELPSEEHIHFPRGYSRGTADSPVLVPPISRVIRL